MKVSIDNFIEEIVCMKCGKPLGGNGEMTAYFLGNSWYCGPHKEKELARLSTLARSSIYD